MRGATSALRFGILDEIVVFFFENANIGTLKSGCKARCASIALRIHAATAKFR
jgi:hypothetical protein